MTSLEFSLFHSYTDQVSLPISLRSGNCTADLLCTVDTGASHCVFQRLYGESLQLDIEAGDRRGFDSAGGRVEAFGHLVQIVTFDLTFESLVYFFANPAIRKNLLGRTGWLDRVRLGVVHYDREIYFAPYDYRSS